MQIRFLGQSAFELTHDGTTLLVDPFLSGNPKAVTGPGDHAPDAILLTHGHGDHLGDTVEIAKRSGATVVAIVELAAEIARSGVEVANPNLGGTATFDWGWVKLVPAWHTAVTSGGTPHTPAGLLISLGGTLVYHLGDTCLFSDLALNARGRGGRVDVALVPIGGHYTMDRHDAVLACELVGARQVIPCHYDTFPAIEADARAFKAEVEAAGHGEVVVLAPGETHQP